MTRMRMGAAVGVLSLLIGGLLATAAPANAGTTHDHARSQDVWVTVTGDGSHARVSDEHVRPGWVTLHVADHTSPAIGVQLTVVRMREHYPVSRLLADIAVQVSQTATPAQGAASTRDIDKIAVAYGGADTMGNQPYFRSDTVKLSGRGSYYLINSGAKNGPAVVGCLDVRGHGSDSEAPRYSGVVTLGTGSADTITLSGHMPSRGAVKVRNDGDSVHLLAINKVANGVTDAQVQAEYDVLMAGGTPTSDPAGLFSQSTVSTGSDAVSPGHASVFRYYLPRGTYLLQCFVLDDTTGIPHAFMGMHLVVRVH